MNELELVRKAACLASRYHAGQTRKYSGRPYLEHPTRVAASVMMNNGSAEEIAAAWLHDVIEDCGVTGADLIAEGMPSQVVVLVLELTNTSKIDFPKATRSERKVIDRERLITVSPEAKRIKLLDRIDNLWELVRDRPNVPDQFQSLYAAESIKLMEAIAPDGCEPIYEAVEALGFSRNHTDRRA